MKKLLCLILAALSLFLVSCGNNDKVDNSCSHEFMGAKRYYCLKDGDEGEEIYTLDKCIHCDEQVKVKGQVVSGQKEIAPALHKAEKGDVIYLKKSRYVLINVLKSLEDVTFYAEDENIVEKVVLAPEEGLKNVTFRNMNFITTEGGLFVMSDVDGITVKDCAFEGGVQFADDATASPLIKDVVIESTSFTRIGNGGKLTAVRLKRVDNLNLISCTFDDIEYNAIQIGGTKLTGSVVIRGNSFKNTVSRVIHLANNEITSCDISDNSFYDNTDLDVSSGRYVHGYNGNIVIGMNRWEIIPNATDDNFSGVSEGKATYDKDEQLLIEE